jgi:hypothetical protein
VLGDVLEGEIRLEWIAASRPSIVVAEKGAPITVTA